MTQYVLPLPVRPHLSDRDFLITGANELAAAWIDRWPDWPQRRLALVGPAGSGKSHLALVWAARTGAAVVDGPDLQGDLTAAALVIDHADQAPATPLLHCLNQQAETAGSVLLLARTPPTQWPFRLKDLTSRLATVAVAEIAAPDDALMEGLLLKHAHDRQLVINPAVVQLFTRHLERSAAAAAKAITLLDELSLRTHRRATVSLARQVVAQLATDPS